MTQSSLHPRIPFRLGQPDGESIGESREWNLQQHGFIDELLHPSGVAVLGVRVPELMVPLGISINEGLGSELLRKSVELTERRGSLGQIDEMSLYAPFGKEAKCLARIRVLLQAEDLNFHGQGKRK
jgi:hypothetical protein